MALFRKTLLVFLKKSLAKLPTTDLFVGIFMKYKTTNQDDGCKVLKCTQANQGMANELFKITENTLFDYLSSMKIKKLSDDKYGLTDPLLECNFISFYND